MPADWNDGADVVKAIAILCFFAAMALAVWISVLGSRRRADNLELERREKIKQAAELGVTDTEGNPLCVVCGGIATHPTVRTGRPWFDKLPVVKTLDRLWARSPRYSIEVDHESGARLCLSDRANAERKLERIHANWRARHAEFNAQIMEESSVLDQGGLEQALRDERARIRSRFAPAPRVLATLPEPHDDEVHLAPVTSEEIQS